MKSFLYHTLTLFITTLLAHAGEAVTLKLSTNECLPGDIVELTATSSTPSYQEFTLSIPAHKNLQLLAHETGPVTLENNHFSQTNHWVFQTVAPDSITLDDITATFTANSEPIPLAPLTLTIGTYPTLDTDLTPAVFPTAATTSATLNILWGLIPAALLIGIIVASKSRKQSPISEAAPIPTIEQLKAQLANNALPEELCYQLLNRRVLSERQKILIEQALYQPSFTANDLLQALNQGDDA
ncbi:hypothetical protein ACFPK9_12775 [Rubritalea spongiae]|uniref:Protein BatD n=1 Tax=Rubritalea spongiae TaxID=430797 RepID=A0ABW5E0F2_9BACT